MISYISLLNFISVEFVTSHLPKVFSVSFCLLSSRYLFLLAYLLVFPLILSRYISQMFPLTGTPGGILKVMKFESAFKFTAL